VEEPKLEILVNVTHADRLGSCSVVLWSDGRIVFELCGFGTSGSTERMLRDLSEGMEQLDDDQEFRCTVDMRGGTGCSPLALPLIVRFLRAEGARIECTAVLGPRPLMVLARLIAQAVSQPGVQFFSEVEGVEAWLSQGRR